MAEDTTPAKETTLRPPLLKVAQAILVANPGISGLSGNPTEEELHAAQRGIINKLIDVAKFVINDSTSLKTSLKKGLLAVNQFRGAFQTVAAEETGVLLTDSLTDMFMAGRGFYSQTLYEGESYFTLYYSRNTAL